MIETERLVALALQANPAFRLATADLSAFLVEFSEHVGSDDE